MYDRDGNIALGPLPGNAFWQGFGGICETQNDGDPIVLYDQLADRWFVSQFAFPAFPGPPYVQCVAVSVTDDPTGAYYQYAVPAAGHATSTTIRSSACGPTATT